MTYILNGAGACEWGHAGRLGNDPQPQINSAAFPYGLARKTSLHPPACCAAIEVCQVRGDRQCHLGAGYRCGEIMAWPQLTPHCQSGPLSSDPRWRDPRKKIFLSQLTSSRRKSCMALRCVRERQINAGSYKATRFVSSLLAVECTSLRLQRTACNAANHHHGTQVRFQLVGRSQLHSA